MCQPDKPAMLVAVADVVAAIGWYGNEMYMWHWAPCSTPAHGGSLTYLDVQLPAPEMYFHLFISQINAVLCVLCIWRISCLIDYIWFYFPQYCHWNRRTRKKSRQYVECGRQFGRCFLLQVVKANACPVPSIESTHGFRPISLEVGWFQGNAARLLWLWMRENWAFVFIAQEDVQSVSVCKG